MTTGYTLWISGIKNKPIKQILNQDLLNVSGHLRTSEPHRPAAVKLQGQGQGQVKDKVGVAVPQYAVNLSDLQVSPKWEKIWKRWCRIWNIYNTGMLILLLNKNCIHRYITTVSVLKEVPYCVERISTSVCVPVSVTQNMLGLLTFSQLLSSVIRCCCWRIAVVQYIRQLVAWELILNSGVWLWSFGQILLKRFDNCQ